MEDISKGWGQPMMQPCGKEHFTCEECGRVRLRQILEQAKKHEPMVPLRLVIAIDEAFDGSNTHSDQWISNVRAAIRAAREGE